jgi:hypothetical protein
LAIAGIRMSSSLLALGLGIRFGFLHGAFPVKD